MSLQIDDTYIHFNDGPNYIIGYSNTGKTTVFNCIKYALGLAKDIVHRHLRQIELVVSINQCSFVFRREVGSAYLSVSQEGDTFKYRALSKELDEFLKDVLLPTYIYGSNTESVFALLDFCFLSEERTVNRRQQWDAINSICGINVSLLRNVENDISALKKEVAKNKELEKIIDNFSNLLEANFNENLKNEDFDRIIKLSKDSFFEDFREKESLLFSAVTKFEEFKERSEIELKSKLSEIEDAFFSLNQYAGFERSFFEGLELFIKDRSKTMSYGEEIFSRFMLVLAVAKVAQDNRYSFPQLIVNDSFLSFDLDNRAYKQSLNIIDNLISGHSGLQYIEFTHNTEVPKEYVVLNLNMQGGQHVFGS